MPDTVQKAQDAASAASTPDRIAARPASDLLALVERTAGLSDSVGRSDLVSRLSETKQRLMDPFVRVIIVGQFKQGKSKLVNALVNAPACPVDDDIATSVPTSVSYGDQPEAFALIRSDGDQSIERRSIALDDLAEFVSEKGQDSVPVM